MSTSMLAMMTAMTVCNLHFDMANREILCMTSDSDFMAKCRCRSHYFVAEVDVTILGDDSSGVETQNQNTARCFSTYCCRVSR